MPLDMTEAAFKQGLRNDATMALSSFVNTFDRQEVGPKGGEVPTVLVVK